MSKPEFQSLHGHRGAVGPPGFPVTFLGLSLLIKTRSWWGWKTAHLLWLHVLFSREHDFCKFR